MVQEVMARNIPNNLIPTTPITPSSRIGDFSETFNLDLTSNYGSIRVSGNFRGTGTDTTPNAFVFYDSKYYTVDDSVMSSGQTPHSTFSNVGGSGAPTFTRPETADLEIFNGDLYVSGTGSGSGLHRYDGSWTTVSASGLNSNTEIHLLKQFAGLIYISDATKVRHATTADALNLTGTSTFDPGLDGSEWTITMLEASFDSLWIGYLNTENGTGLVYEWDGSSENTAIRKLVLEAGVLAGTVKDNVPYIIDIRGRLKRYSGTAFVTVGCFNTDPNISFEGSDEQPQVNQRMIHPNGMTVTDSGRILVLFKNTLMNGSYADDIPSGIYEYDENIGLYHKYAVTNSTNTTVNNYGDSRLVEVGALFYRRPNVSPGDDGTFLYGAQYYTDATSTDYSVFFDDNLETKQKYGYFVTSEMISSNVEDTWQKVYIKYKKLLNSADKVVVKYRTEVIDKTEAECLWATTNRLLTNTDVSAYSEGDEVQIIQGRGSGKSAHIISITPHGGGYEITLDETFTNATGTCIAFFDKWIKAGEATYSDGKRYKGFTLTKDNISPMVQFKVCMQFTGKDELYGLHIVNKNNINE